jgi:hypothetical protein
VLSLAIITYLSQISYEQQAPIFGRDGQIAEKKIPILASSFSVTQINTERRNLGYQQVIHKAKGVFMKVNLPNVPITISKCLNNNIQTLLIAINIMQKRLMRCISFCKYYYTYIFNLKLFVW